MSESAKKKLSGGVAGAGRGRAPGGKNRQTAGKTGVVSAKGKASQRDPGNGMKSASGKHGSRKAPEKAEAKKPGASAAGKASIPGKKKATTSRPAGATAKKATAVKKTIAAGAKASAGKTVSEKRSKSAGKRAASAKKATTAAKTAPAKQSKQGRAPSGKKRSAMGSVRSGKGKGARANPVAEAANRRQAESGRRTTSRDMFMDKGGDRPKRKKPGGEPPRGNGTLFGALNACLVIAIAVLIAMAIRQRAAYAEYRQMRDVVDQQTFYEGTTVEGVDVSKMTLSNAMDYWRDRVEERYANRSAVLDDGTAVTARELGYSSDFESVLYAAWSAGRSGSLEERYRMASARVEHPVAYSITRVDYDEAMLDQFVQTVAVSINQPAMDATVADFDPENYEFTFNPSQVGRQLDADALKRSVGEAIRSGGGNVTLEIAETQPQVTTEEASDRYGLIDYAITNASSSSKARLNNIKQAMSYINGKRVSPGETFSFNDTVGQRTTARGFRMATAYSGGEVTEQVGGGICQVSTTLFNAAVKADMKIVERHNHSLTVHYVDKGKDATVDWGHQDLKFKNDSDDDIYICCYLTNDKRVRFGIFGRLLPNGEKITVEAVTTEVIKYETEYQKSPLLAPGETSLLQNGRNGYKAEAYKVRWDGDGNQLSRELLCKSYYKVKNEIIQYGA